MAALGIEYDAIVVGSGPNGLAAAITIAREKRSVLLVEAKDTIGGGTRTKELTLRNFVHDVCSAIHPLALASPFFRALDLSRFGLEWIHSPAPLAHPMDGQNAIMLYRSVEFTSQNLGIDSASYKNTIGYCVRHWKNLTEELLKPLGAPKHPWLMMKFGKLAIRSAVGVANSLFRDKRARALFAGNAAHSILPLNRLSSAAFGLMLPSLGHAVGWPIAKGGSQAIANALGSYLESLGGAIRLSSNVTSVDDLPKCKAILFDVTPRSLLHIAGTKFPDFYCKNLEKHKYGPGVFKIDWALKGPTPWLDERCLEAATAHIGGELEEIAEAESSVWQGVAPQKPFVFFAQPSLFDHSRAPEGMHTAWGYCHVPNACEIDMTDRVESQLERFAPGFRDNIVARHAMFPKDMEAYNPNYVGGDIIGGSPGLADLFVRPLGRWRPYTTPAKGIYICSSSMPPGGGVHGMCGYLAAKRVLWDMF